MKYLNENKVEEIAELFMGRRIIGAEIFNSPKKFEKSWRQYTGKLVLDDGREVYISPNEGGCICGAGDYELTHLATVDNIITRVDVINDPASDGTYNQETQAYRIFVFAGHEQINAMIVDGDDGNGYYGTGYELLIIDSGETVK